MLLLILIGAGIAGSLFSGIVLDCTKSYKFLLVLMNAMAFLFMLIFTITVQISIWFPVFCLIMLGYQHNLNKIDSFFIEYISNEWHLKTWQIFHDCLHSDRLRVRSWNNISNVRRGLFKSTQYQFYCILRISSNN